MVMMSTDATSSSVISDLADAADNLLNEAGSNHGFVPVGSYGNCLPVNSTESSYYLRLRVKDVPGVIASISRILADRGIGIMSVQQPEVESGGDADLMMMLHKAPFGTMQAAKLDIAALPVVVSEPVMLRVESLGGKV